MEEKDKSKISDNPSIKELNDLLPIVDLVGGGAKIFKRFGVNRDRINDICELASNIQEEKKLIGLPDRFNELFADKGWICIGEMSADMMQEAVNLAEEGKDSEAEKVILNWFDEDCIRSFAIINARQFSKAQGRENQLNEALSLYNEKRFIAAVPLILIACDGLASDVSGKSPFAKDADLSVYDSIAGHETGLPALIGILTKGAQRSYDDEMSLPERHKILHGRATGYANQVVCAKAWLLMMAIVSWARDKATEQQRRQEAEKKSNISLHDEINQYRKTLDDKRQIEAFKPSEYEVKFSDHIDPETPLEAISEFLQGWQSMNFGKMAKFSIDSKKKPVNQIAGNFRGFSQLVELEEYKVIHIRHTTVARCDVQIWLKAKTVKGMVEGKLDVMLLLLKENGCTAMPYEEASWCVQSQFMHKVNRGDLAE